jgi:hypothetical protein
MWFVVWWLVIKMNMYPAPPKTLLRPLTNKNVLEPLFIRVGLQILLCSTGTTKTLLVETVFRSAYGSGK